MFQLFEGSLQTWWGAPLFRFHSYSWTCCSSSLVQCTPTYTPQTLNQAINWPKRQGGFSTAFTNHKGCRKPTELPQQEKVWALQGTACQERTSLDMAQSTGWWVDICARKQGTGQFQYEFGTCISSLHWHKPFEKYVNKQSGKYSSWVFVPASPECYHLRVLIQKQCNTRQNLMSHVLLISWQV